MERWECDLWVDAASLIWSATSWMRFAPCLIDSVDVSWCVVMRLAGREHQGCARFDKLRAWMTKASASSGLARGFETLGAVDYRQ